MTSKSKKTNVVFFFTDDQRFNTINALGNKEIKTPNMDKLVAGGTSFTHAHIPCGTSGAVCMPSRAMLHSSKTLFHLKDAGHSIPKNHSTLGETLRKNGYHTFGSGKWHNGRESFNRSFSHGAEIFFGGMADHWNVPVYNYDPSGKYQDIKPEVKNPGFSNEVTIRQCDHVNVGKHSTEMIADAAIDFINEYNSEDPFFMYLSFLAPHDPRTMPEKFLKMYDPEKIKLPENFMGGHPFDNGDLHIRDEKLAGFPRSPEETKRHIAEYYAMITHLDYEIGRVMKILEKKGIAENTIFILSGDNGLAVGQHGLFGKQNCYEHSVRVPLIMAGPGIPRNSQTQSFVYLLDIFPTLCDMLDIDIPKSVEGISFAEILKNNKKETREYLYFAYTSKQRAIKNHQYKLIEYVINGKHTMTQLFDLKRDPWELNNLAFRKDKKKVVDKLRKKLIESRDKWDDKKTEFGKIFWKDF